MLAYHYNSISQNVCFKERNMFTVWMGIEPTTSCLQVGCSFNKAAWAVINYIFTSCVRFSPVTYAYATWQFRALEAWRQINLTIAVTRLTKQFRQVSHINASNVIRAKMFMARMRIEPTTSHLQVGFPTKLPEQTQIITPTAY